MGKLKNRNRVMGVIWELHRTMGCDPVWGGIREDFLEEEMYDLVLKEGMWHEIAFSEGKRRRSFFQVAV